jgi:hypothetical protein
MVLAVSRDLWSEQYKDLGTRLSHVLTMIYSEPPVIDRRLVAT